MDGVLTRLSEAARLLRLGSVRPEDMFLLRFEDKIWWVQVLELGNGYTTFSLKGMELQETSCHSLEATRIDDIFDAAFEKKKVFNTFLSHTLTPLTRIPVSIYSDTKNNLTAVMTDSDTLRNVVTTFVEALLWLLITRAKDYVKARPAAGPASHTNSIDEVVHFHPEQDGPGGGGGDSWHSASTASSLDQGEAAWAARSSLAPAATPELRPRPKLGSMRLQEDNLSIGDIADIDDDFNFEKYIQPALSGSKGKPLVNAKYIAQQDDSLLQQMDQLLPGGLNKTPQLGRRNTSSSFLQLSPPRLVPGEESAAYTRHKLPDHWMLVCESSNFDPAGSAPWFPHEFYDALISDKEANSLASLRRSYTRFVAFLLEGVYGAGAGRDPGHAHLRGPLHLLNTFTSLRAADSGWPHDLEELVQAAFRYSVKIAIDKSILGGYDNNELQEAFTDIHTNWFIGLESEAGWTESVRNQVPNLFGLSSARSSENGQLIYRSRILSLKNCDVNVGRLNKEVVKSLWASLSLGEHITYLATSLHEIVMVFVMSELLYLTNDDEERYSIQAEERLLRNLTVQAADPPLGYFIYSSKPISKTGCDI